MSDRAKEISGDTLLAPRGKTFARPGSAFFALQKCQRFFRRTGADHNVSPSWSLQPKGCAPGDDSAKGPLGRIWGGLVLCLLLLVSTGCASPTRPQSRTGARHFDFARDTFAYANGLVWEYRYDATGRWTTRRREPRPSYSQHCFVVSRSACQFFENAAFEPQLPKADAPTYQRLVRQLVSTTLRRPLPNERKVVIPGYSDLRSFSQANEQLLKRECGGAWRCYFQRGNWRIIFPFSRHQQAHVTEQLLDELQSRGAAVVHLARFPQLSINHAVLIFDAKPNPTSIEFTTYDPNEPESPVTITYNRAAKTFYLPPNAYFPGGRVDAYPIYDRLLY